MIPLLFAALLAAEPERVTLPLSQWQAVTNAIRTTYTALGVPARSWEWMVKGAEAVPRQWQLQTNRGAELVEPVLIRTHWYPEGFRVTTNTYAWDTRPAWTPGSLWQVGPNSNLVPLTQTPLVVLETNVVTNTWVGHNRYAPENAIPPQPGQLVLGVGYVEWVPAGTNYTTNLAIGLPGGLTLMTVPLPK